MRTPPIAPPRPADGTGESPEPWRAGGRGIASPALVAFGAAAALIVLAVVGA